MATPRNKASLDAENVANCGFECNPIFIYPHQSLLERFEETLAEAAQEEDSEADYEGTNQDPEHSQASREWSLDQEGDQGPLISERSQSPAEGHSRTASQRSHLQDLLMTTRKRTSSCFGARMDRIGNASGLGCNNGRG
ncbi:natriuretic peptides A [Larimichthys crocea]|uniref:natriuretic peptides A n=1 Tax=Larimichthys crocea TaxID=215358 RepID=UPI000F5DE62D|nr:natriuretic peptides A-like [Larimichthys crocea]